MKKFTEKSEYTRVNFLVRQGPAMTFDGVTRKNASIELECECQCYFSHHSTYGRIEIFISTKTKPRSVVPNHWFDSRSCNKSITITNGSRSIFRKKPEYLNFFRKLEELIF